MANVPKQSKRPTGNGPHHIDIRSAQCAECSKWREILTEEEYEEIRSKFLEVPFVCSMKPCVSCEDPPDLEFDDSRIWVIDKPNLPKTPPGFRRRMVMRKDFSKMDCYYDTPNGKRLRALTEVERFLDQHPEYKKDLSKDNFSFTSPKVRKADSPPTDIAKKG